MPLDTAPPTIVTPPAPPPVLHQQELPLRWHRSDGPPPGPATTDGARVVHRGPAAGQCQAGRPEPGAWVAALVQSVLEVLAGDRPVTQLLRWLDLPVYEALAARARPSRRRTPPGAVRSVHLCEPAPGVVEASVVVGGALRSRAGAVRLEAVADRWRCTGLTIL
jgi:hypothetical protein